jgi:hypothetical protein
MTSRVVSNAPRHIRRSRAAGVVTLALVAAGPLSAAERTGWYAAGSVGASSVELRADYPRDGFVSLDDDRFAVGLELGWAANPHLAIELGYYDLGEPGGRGFFCPPGAVCALVIQGAEADAEAWALSIAPSWPVTDRLALYAELGVARWQVAPRLEGGPRRNLPDVDGSDFRAAAGARLALTQRLDLQAEVAGFDDQRTYLLGLRWWLRPHHGP